MRWPLVLPVGALMLGIASCATTRDDPAASPRAGCEITGGHWHEATHTCDKD